MTMDSGAAGHVMIEGMFPRVKLERKIAPNKFVAVIGAIRDMCEKTIPFKKSEGSASVVRPLISMQKAVRLKTFCGAERKESAHFEMEQ